MLRRTVLCREPRSTGGTQSCCYRILGFEGTHQDRTDKVALKKAFRRKATILHPDVAGTGNEVKYRELQEAHAEAVRRSSPSQAGTNYPKQQRSTDFYDHPHGGGNAKDPSWNPTDHGSSKYDSRQQAKTPGNYGFTAYVWFCRVAAAYVFYLVYAACQKHSVDVEEIHAARDNAHAVGSYAGTHWGRTDGKTDVRPISPSDVKATGPGQRIESTFWLTEGANEQAAALRKQHVQQVSGRGTSKANTKVDENAEVTLCTVGISYGGYPFTPEGQEARRQTAVRLRRELRHQKTDDPNGKETNPNRSAKPSGNQSDMHETLLCDCLEEREAYSAM